jgi:predicted transcriptional regulator
MTHQEKVERKQRILEFIKANPLMTFKEIGEATGCSKDTIAWSRKMGLVRNPNMPRVTAAQQQGAEKW